MLFRPAWPEWPNLGTVKRSKPGGGTRRVWAAQAELRPPGDQETRLQVCGLCTEAGRIVMALAPKANVVAPVNGAAAVNGTGVPQI
jgi:hypothetical protein